MKLIFKDIGLLSFVPQKKCGADPISAAVMGGVSAIGSIGGSLIGADSSSSNVNSQIAAQRQENQLNRDWQTQEAEKARQYNTGERLATQQFQQGLINQMNAYNSPVNQAQMFRDANINPNLALGGQGAIVSANPSQGSPQSSPMPSGVSGLSPVGFQPLDLHIPQLLNGIGSFMRNVGEAEKLGVETDYAKASFNMNLRKLNADASTQEFYSAGLQLENAIKQATKDPAIAKAFEECKKVHWDAILSEQKGISEKLQQQVLESQKNLNEAVARYNGNNADLIKLDVQHYEEAFNMRMKIGTSQVAANYGTASAANASAEQTQIFNKFYNDKRYAHSFMTQVMEQGRQAVKQTDITENQVKQLNYLVEQAAYANDMKEFTYWSGQVNNFVNTLGQAASQFYGAGALRELIKLRQGQGQPLLESGKGYYMQDGLLFKRP